MNSYTVCVITKAKGIVCGTFSHTAFIWLSKHRFAIFERYNLSGLKSSLIKWVIEIFITVVGKFLADKSTVMCEYYHVGTKTALKRTVVCMAF